MEKTARRLLENPLRRRLRLFDDQAIDAVAFGRDYDRAESAETLIGQSECYDRVLFAIIGPEHFAIEGQ